jgi:hypothetical protein
MPTDIRRFHAVLTDKGIGGHVGGGGVASHRRHLQGGHAQDPDGKDGHGDQHFDQG